MPPKSFCGSGGISSDGGTGRILRNLHFKIGSKKSHSLHLFFAWRPAINKLILGVLYGLSFSNHSIEQCRVEYYSLLLLC